MDRAVRPYLKLETVSEDTDCAASIFNYKWEGSTFLYSFTGSSCRPQTSFLASAQQTFLFLCCGTVTLAALENNWP